MSRFLKPPVESVLDCPEFRGVLNALEQKKSATLEGLWGSSTSLFTSAVYCSQSAPILVIISENEDLGRVADDFRFFLANLSIESVPADERKTEAVKTTDVLPSSSDKNCPILKHSVPDDSVQEVSSSGHFALKRSELEQLKDETLNVSCSQNELPTSKTSENENLADKNLTEEEISLRLKSQLEELLSMDTELLFPEQNIKYSLNNRLKESSEKEGTLFSSSFADSVKNVNSMTSSNSNYSVADVEFDSCSKNDNSLNIKELEESKSVLLSQILPPQIDIFPALPIVPSQNTENDELFLTNDETFGDRLRLLKKILGLNPSDEKKGCPVDSSVHFLPFRNSEDEFIWKTDSDSFSDKEINPDFYSELDQNATGETSSISDKKTDCKKTDCKKTDCKKTSDKMFFDRNFSDQNSRDKNSSHQASAQKSTLFDRIRSLRQEKTLAADNLNDNLSAIDSANDSTENNSSEISLKKQIPERKSAPKKQKKSIDKKNQKKNINEQNIDLQKNAEDCLVNGSEDKKTFTRNIIITTPSALLQPIPTKNEILNATLILRCGMIQDPQKLVEWMLQGAFHSVPAVELPGEYAVRGGVIDIFATDWEKPVRFEFFGDEIDSIRRFEVGSQRSLEILDEIEITRLSPNRLYQGNIIDLLPDGLIPVLFEPERLNDAARLYRERNAVPTSGKKHQTKSLFSNSVKPPKTPNIIDPAAQPKTPQNSDNLNPVDSNANNSSANSSNAFNSNTPKSEALIDGLHRWTDILNPLLRRPHLNMVYLATENEIADVKFSFPMKSTTTVRGSLEVVTASLNRLWTDRAVVVCQTEAESKRLSSAFAETLPCRRNALFLPVGHLSEGFYWCSEKIMLVGTAQLFNRSTVRQAGRRFLGQVIDRFTELSPGDLVIHISHGLARFRGLKTIKKAQQEEEHIELEFADNVVLNVPASQIGLIQKYVGGTQKNIKLANYGGISWNKKKSEVTKAVLELAFEMVELQAKRNALSGVAFPPDSDWQIEFDESFPFQETNDQLLAIESIKKDMQASRPMDRLLCGDVGFGKTEVAVRAAFKAADAGYQVAVLVPTTILAEQHARVFRERMSTFPLKIASLSRFSTKKEQEKTLKEVAEGKIDIVIGTHRIIQKDVLFKNLGLVIIDEEQRFGVKDKERLKKMRSMVDILTMTATPIPRTLHFALIGLRDISNLETPPEDRLPVETRIIRFDFDFIRDGILKEIKRGGQVFFLHNRVNDIEIVAEEIRQRVPEARVGVGHAQMEDAALENVMREFVEHQYDVLVCTTIIESGLDIPNANTIFINNADYFGLAELHQLRGRVGRYRNQAYCYLLIAPGKPLTTISAKRLRAIEEYSHLGSGFNIAMRDLEIRGAGNIVGTQQSGHINAVGYEMYCQLLEGAVRTLKKLPPKKVVEVDVDLPGTALIPSFYVSDQRLKIDLYRRIVRISNYQEWNELRSEIIDRFGKLPSETKRLFLISEIRLEAWRHRIRSIRLFHQSEGDYIAFEYFDDLRIQQWKDSLPHLPIRILPDEKKAFLLIADCYRDKNRNLLPDELLEHIRRILAVRS